MTLFDLLFLASLAGSLFLLARTAWHLLRGRRADAARLAARLGVYLGIYGVVLVAVSLATPQRRLAIGEDQCFDDWCIAVRSVARQPDLGRVHARGMFWIVTTRVSSRARGRKQRENGTYAYLTDGLGRRFDVSPEAQAELARSGMAGPPLTAFVEPGGGFESRLAFDVPRDAADVGFVKAGGWFPTAFIIGDPGSLLHRRTIVALETPR